MQCPVDGTTLMITDRQGIEIDYCPKCRGIWLDRGELDKLIERGAQYEAQTRSTPAPPPRATYIDDDDDTGEYYPEKPKRGYGDYGDREYRRKRRSFLDDVFDIFD